MTHFITIYPKTIFVRTLECEYSWVYNRCAIEMQIFQCSKVSDTISKQTFPHNPKLYATHAILLIGQNPVVVLIFNSIHHSFRSIKTFYILHEITFAF